MILTVDICDVRARDVGHPSGPAPYDEAADR